MPPRISSGPLRFSDILPASGKVIDTETVLAPPNSPTPHCTNPFRSRRRYTTEEPYTPLRSNWYRTRPPTPYAPRRATDTPSPKPELPVVSHAVTARPNLGRRPRTPMPPRQPSSPSEYSASSLPSNPPLGPLGALQTTTSHSSTSNPPSPDSFAAVHHAATSSGSLSHAPSAPPLQPTDPHFPRRQSALRHVQEHVDLRTDNAYDARRTQSRRARVVTAEDPRTVVLRRSLSTNALGLLMPGHLADERNRGRQWASPWEQRVYEHRRREVEVEWQREVGQRTMEEREWRAREHAVVNEAVAEAAEALRRSSAARKPRGERRRRFKEAVKKLFR